MDESNDTKNATQSASYPADCSAQDIAIAVKSMARVFDDDLTQRTKEGLEEYWHFEWDTNLSAEVNLYKFHDLLGPYGRACRRWEEKHNGYICVVERVRDEYLMPKIRALLDDLSQNVRLKATPMNDN